MDKFIRQYGPVLEEYDQQLSKVSPWTMGSPKGSMDLILRTQALQMHNWAAEIATTKRHGFLKKIIEEIR